MTGCTISPLAFTMAKEIIIRALKWVVGGKRLQCGQRLPPIRAYMDDITTMTTTVPCTKRLLEKLHQDITWARMKIKPSKCRSISIVKGQVTHQRFHIGGRPLPTVFRNAREELGPMVWCEAKGHRAGKLKLWCFQFDILPRLMWHITVYEIPINKVEKLERMIRTQVKQ